MLVILSRCFLFTLFALSLVSLQAKGEQHQLMKRAWGLTKNRSPTTEKGSTSPKEKKSFSLNPFSRSSSKQKDAGRNKAVLEPNSPTGSHRSESSFSFSPFSRGSSKKGSSAHSSASSSPNASPDSSYGHSVDKHTARGRTTTANNVHANGVASAPQSPTIASQNASPFAATRQHRNARSAPVSPTRGAAEVEPPKPMSPSQRQKKEAGEHLKFATHGVAHGTFRLVAGVPLGVAGALSSAGGSVVSLARGDVHKAGEQIKDAPLKVLHGAGYAVVGGAHALTEAGFNACSAASCGVRMVSSALKGKNRQQKGESITDKEHRFSEQGRRARETKDTVHEWKMDVKTKTMEHAKMMLNPKPYKHQMDEIDGSKHRDH